MPLVIAVLIAVAIFATRKDDKKKYDRQVAERAEASRKTNAKLEQRLFDTYLKHGYSPDDAFRQTCQDMCQAGFEPCIPRDAYLEGKSDYSSLCTCDNGWSGRNNLERFRPGAYDSTWVHQRREAITRSWKINRPGEELTSEELERLTYTNFPKNEQEYQRDINISANIFKAAPVGSFIIYPGLGTCEVLGYEWIDSGALGGRYKLRVLKTGEMVTHVSIGDEKIRKQ